MTPVLQFNGNSVKYIVIESEAVLQKCKEACSSLKAKLTQNSAEEILKLDKIFAEHQLREILFISSNDEEGCYHFYKRQHSFRPPTIGSSCKENITIENTLCEIARSEPSESTKDLLNNMDTFWLTFIVWFFIFLFFLLLISRKCSSRSD